MFDDIGRATSDLPYLLFGWRACGRHRLIGLEVRVLYGDRIMERSSLWPGHVPDAVSPSCALLLPTTATVTVSCILPSGHLVTVLNEATVRHRINSPWGRVATPPRRSASRSTVARNHFLPTPVSRGGISAKEILNFLRSLQNSVPRQELSLHLGLEPRISSASLWKPKPTNHRSEDAVSLLKSFRYTLLLQYNPSTLPPLAHRPHASSLLYVVYSTLPLIQFVPPRPWVIIIVDIGHRKLCVSFRL